MHSDLCCTVTMLLAGVILAAPADAGQRHHHHESDSTGFALGKFGGPEGWTTYVDPDTGTTVDYPANVFSAKDDKPDQNSGVIFRTPDRSAKLAVYFLPNDSHETPHSYVKHHLKIDRSHLSYDRVTRKFFAISGKHGLSTADAISRRKVGTCIACTLSIPSATRKRGMGLSRGSVAH